MQGNMKQFIQLMSTTEYITADALSSKMGISPKTVRIRIKEMKDELSVYGVQIESKSRFGYILVLDGDNRLEELLNNKEENEVPDNMEERTSYLLAYLINYGGYIKIDSICDFLYVSRSTLHLSLKKVERILNRYDIHIDRRPNYGVKAAGSEFNFRLCIAECFVQYNMLNLDSKIQTKGIENIAEIILPLLKKHGIRFSEIALENFLTQVYIGLKRMEKERFVSIDEIDVVYEDGREYNFAKEFYEIVQSDYGIACREEEVRYLMVHLAGRRMMGDSANMESAMFIREEINTLVQQMLQRIYQEFQIDLRNNFELKMNLDKHMVPLDIRIRYHIRLSNPLLEDIKQQYSFAYALSKRAAIVLEQYYGENIEEDEIGYLATIFALAIEQQSYPAEKHNILIVCGSGNGSARLLMFRYRKEFGEYIDKIYTCAIQELEDFDFQKVDYVFSTVPIKQKNPVTVIEVGNFLGAEDIKKVKIVFEKNTEFLRKYYKQDQFFTDITANSKEEVISFLVDRAKEKYAIPGGFYESVMEREQLAHTDFGNLIAMPHPIRSMMDESFVYVGIIRTPILWHKYEVQVVFLICMGKMKDAELMKFYDSTSNFLLNKVAVQSLIDGKSFELLVQLLANIQGF